MSRILVTGAGGLIGSHLVPALQKEHEVFTISGKRNDANNIVIDFTKEWDESILPLGVDTVIHLAQSEHFKDFPGRAVEVFQTNTASTLKLVDYAQKTGVKQFIFASSGGVYGNSDNLLTEEQQIVYKEQLGFYLATKHCAEVLLDNYKKFIDIVHLRIFFVYGKGQRADMLVPRLVASVKEGKPITLQGEEGIRINPTHVSDAVAAIKAALQLKGSHTINLAGPEVLSLKAVADTIGELVGKEPNLIFQTETKAAHLMADTAKMASLLTSSVKTFRQGVQDLI